VAIVDMGAGLGLGVAAANPLLRPGEGFTLIGVGGAPMSVWHQDCETRARALARDTVPPPSPPVTRTSPPPPGVRYAPLYPTSDSNSRLAPKRPRVRGLDLEDT
jgi:hypothetical protein